MYGEGKKAKVIARNLKLSNSTVSTILQDREKKFKAVKRSALNMFAIFALAILSNVKLNVLQFTVFDELKK